MSTESPSNSTSQPDIQELSHSLKRFGAADYTVFLLMLTCCTFVGIYFGYVEHKRRKTLIRQDSKAQAAEYLMGGGDMGVWPIALSLTATLVSGNLLLGLATEMYLYGSQYIFSVISMAIAAVFLHYIIIPVFHDLRITSAYEYLERRFDKKLRIFGSLMFMIGVNLYLPIVIYVPALAFSHVANINVHFVTPLCLIVCIFYTCLGGMKAVVWTDVIQVIILYITLIVVAVKGTIDVGGFSTVIQRNWDTGRIQGPDLRIDPTIRHSFWTIVIGFTLFQISANGLNQNIIQRFMSLRTIKKARLSNMINMTGVILMIIISCYNGLLTYAAYYNCCPLTTGLVDAKDQLLPLMVMENFTDIPGLAGFFVSGVFAAALSTLSTAYNSMAAVVFEDFFRIHIKKEISETLTFVIMRATVLIFGIVTILLVFIVEHMGQLLQLSFTIPATSLGPMLGVFTIGLMIPWIGKRATFYSVVFVYFAMLIIVLKAQFHVAKGTIKYDQMPTSTEGCTYNFTHSDFFTTTTTTTPSSSTFEPEIIEEPKRNISYLYFTLIGAIGVILISSILSLFFGYEDAKKVDPQCLAPFMRKFINSEITPVDGTDYRDDDDEDYGGLEMRTWNNEKNEKK